MARYKSTGELASLQAQALELDKKIKEVAAREKAKREANEHQRRLIAGAAALQHAATHPDGEFASTLLKLVNEGAVSKIDRALFGLSPLPKES